MTDSSPSSAAKLALPSRRNVLRKASAFTLAGGSAALLSGVLSRKVSAAMQTPEHRVAGSRGPAGQRTFFEQIKQHEIDHVAFLVTALGAAARPEPTFQNLEQKHFADFVVATRTFENTGVGAYLGAAPAIDDPTYLAAAGSILTVEARHAGYVNTFLHDPINQNAADNAAPSFDAPLTAAEVAAGVAPFVSSLNGGPDLTYSDTPSPANDIAILNFALALEYLERDFYNINVPKFYKGA